MTHTLEEHKFDLIIFDLDGVLADTTACHRQAFEDLWAEIGIVGPEYDQIAGRKTRDVVAELTAHVRPAAQQLDRWVNFKQARARDYLATVPVVYPDSQSSLMTLKRRGLQLALATGASRETTDMLLARLAAQETFDVVATAEDARHGKPSPEIYLHVMSRAEARPDRTLIIEDSLAGLASAIASGAQVASVRAGNVVDDEAFVGYFPDLRQALKHIGIDVE
jgi:HAD superfamily hydrolase (TIGR01509 family)